MTDQFNESELNQIDLGIIKLYSENCDYIYIVGELGVNKSDNIP